MLVYIVLAAAFFFLIALVGFAMNSALKRLVARFQPTERTAAA